MVKFKWIVFTKIPKCVTSLSVLKKNWLNCVITDPPYFIDKLDDNWDADKVTSDKANSHIKHLPKSMKFSKQQSKDFTTSTLR